jgi:transcriptional regulator with XRE-family HTH domain
MVIRVGTDPADVALRRRQGESIRKIRTLRGMAIVELAEQVGVSPSAVSHWENARWTPRQNQQLRIAKALDVPWSTIFGLDGEVAQ